MSTRKQRWVTTCINLQKRWLYSLGNLTKILQKQYSRSVLRKRFWKYPGKHLCRSGISIMLLCNFIVIALWRGWSPENLLHIFKTSFPKNTSEGFLLVLLPDRFSFQCKGGIEDKEGRTGWEKSDQTRDKRVSMQFTMKNESSRQEVFCKKNVLRNFARFTRFARFLIKTNRFVLVIRLQDVLPRRLQNLFKTSSRRLVKTSSRHLQDVLQDVLKTSSKRLQDVIPEFYYPFKPLKCPKFCSYGMVFSAFLCNMFCPKFSCYCYLITHITWNLWFLHRSDYWWKCEVGTDVKIE